MTKKQTELIINGKRLIKPQLLKSELLDRKINAMIKMATTLAVQVQVYIFSQLKISYT